MAEDEDWYCGAFGPPVTPDGSGYRCTLPTGHEATTHEAWTGSLRLGSWPRIPGNRSTAHA